MLIKSKLRRSLRLESLESRCVLSGAPWGDAIVQLKMMGECEIILASDIGGQIHVLVLSDLPPHDHNHEFEFDEDEFILVPEGEGDPHELPASNHGSGTSSLLNPNDSRPATTPNVLVNPPTITQPTTTQFTFVAGPTARTNPPPSILNFISGSSSQSPTSGSSSDRGPSVSVPQLSNLQPISAPQQLLNGTLGTSLYPAPATLLSNSGTTSNLTVGSRLDSNPTSFSDSAASNRLATTGDSIARLAPHTSQPRVAIDTRSGDLRTDRLTENDTLDDLINRLSHDHHQQRNRGNSSSHHPANTPRATSPSANGDPLRTNQNLQSTATEMLSDDAGMISLAIRRDVLLGDLDELAEDVANERQAWSANIGISRGLEAGGFALGGFTLGAAADSSLYSGTHLAASSSSAATLRRSSDESTHEDTAIQRALASTSVAFFAGLYGVRRVRKIRRLKAVMR